MIETLETPRLLLERFDSGHVEMLADVAATPEVMQYIGSGAVWPRGDAESVAATLLQHWEEHGFGWRGARLKTTGELVGMSCSNFAAEWTVGLKPDEHEIGWWMRPSAQGQGLAKEGAVAARDEAFELGAASVVACIHPENVRSAAGAKAIGLAYDFSTTGPAGQPVEVFRLQATPRG